MTHSTFTALMKKNKRILTYMNKYDGTEQIRFGECRQHKCFFIEIDGAHQDFNSTLALHHYYNDKIALFRGRS